MKNQSMLPIMWHEGMPLEPATFQQNFLYHENKFQFAMKNIAKHHWGLIHCKFDDTYLSGGILRIAELQCIMPDFSMLSLPNDIDKEISIDLKPYIDDFKKGDMYLFLTLPDNHSTYTSNLQKARYSAKEFENIGDLNDAEQTANISFLLPNVTLQLSTMAPLNYVSLPIAKIKHTGINFQLTSYHPPSLKIDQNLTEQITALIKIGRNKLKYLLNQNINNKQTSAITNLANIIFPLEQIIKNAEHPYSLYSKLIACLGSALIFFNSENIPSVPEYEHTDCLASITQLLNYIKSAIDQIQESYNTQFFARQEGMFAIMLPEKTTEYITIGISKQSSINIESTIKWLENAIIASEDKLTTMQDQRLIGAWREQIPYSTTLDLKSRDDMCLFSIKLEPQYIANNNMLCILNFDIENAPADIMLFTTNE